MKVYLAIECDIVLSDGTPDPGPDDQLYDRMCESAKEAISKAIEMAEDNGFVHDMDTITSIVVTSVEQVYEVVDHTSELLVSLQSFAADGVVYSDAELTLLSECTDGMGEILPFQADRFIAARAAIANAGGVNP